MADTQPSSSATGDQAPALDLSVYQEVLSNSAHPVWIYDTLSSSNIWGNRRALELFATPSGSAFTVSQLELLSQSSDEEQQRWRGLSKQLQDDVEVGKKELNVTICSSQSAPGFPRTPDQQAKGAVLKAVYRPLTARMGAGSRSLVLVEVTSQLSNAVEDNHLRLVEMCNNHPMFQFLFDKGGKLLAANQRALCNMREHLGSCENYNLQNYLAIGECDGSMGPEEMYKEAMDAIFRQAQPCHRFPQLRWSKRHPGKYRWVLYEMWPSVDPVTQQKAVLVCEQNISQVKALEEQIKKQNQRLEAQLEEALAQRDPVHKPAIDIDTPADKTLKLLDKLMRGHEVSAREAIELRDAIIQAGDLRQPINFNDQLMKQSNTTLDNEVSESLIQLLSSRRPAKVTSQDTIKEEEGEEAGDVPVRKEQQDLRHIYAKSTVTQDSVKALIAMHKNLPDEVMDVLGQVDAWQFDAFKLNEVSGGRPLSLLSYVLLKRCEVAEKFQMDDHKLVKFLMRVEDGYPNNPYHNRIHAADVLQSLHVLVVRGGLIGHGYCDEISLTSCYLSAIIHDYEHKGVNNDYLIRVSDGLAVLYNDRSPMENHHLAAAFQLMNSDEYNFLRKMPHKTRETLRKQIIEMVLATDMKQHFAIHSMFQAKMQLGAVPSGGSGSGGNKSMRTSPHNTSADGHKIVDEDQRSLVLQVALKCADLGHLASPRIVHKKWVQYLEEEFFRQGDREKQNGLTVSPLMDREKNGITKSQVGFFDIVALPLFQTFSQAFPDATPMLDAVKDNYAMWREEASVYVNNNNTARSSK